MVWFELVSVLVRLLVMLCLVMLYWLMCEWLMLMLSCGVCVGCWMCVLVMLGMWLI